jgi:hypothetical protein
MAAMRSLADLWRGDLPLGEAFWTWAVCGGIAVNAVAKLGFLLLLAEGQVWPAMVVNYAMALPFGILALVGVWRSAARWTGAPLMADLARGSAAAMLVAMSIL